MLDNLAIRVDAKHAYSVIAVVADAELANMLATEGAVIGNDAGSVVVAKYDVIKLSDHMWEPINLPIKLQTGHHWVKILQ